MYLVYLNIRYSPSGKGGLYLSAAFVLLAAASLVLVDVHKRRLKSKKRKLHHTRFDAITRERGDVSAK